MPNILANYNKNVTLHLNRKLISCKDETTQREWLSTLSHFFIITYSIMIKKSVT